jgi:hypothetical protein
LQPGGQGKFLSLSISALRGHSLLLVCTSTTSYGPMPTISKVASDAAARVQA